MRASDLRSGRGVVVRTPLLPVDVLIAWPRDADVAVQRRYLDDILRRSDVGEAIFVASPGLHGTIEKWRAAPESEAGQRAQHALVKYVARMAWRTTPFGLFSGVSTGRLARGTAFHLSARADHRRRTRLDNDYLFLLAAELARELGLREALTWRPSTSIYRLAGRLRYAEARLDGQERSYHLVSVEPSPYLDATLARAAAGARPEELAAGLVADDADIPIDEARTYIRELMDRQLLVPDLGVHVTGPEPLDGMLHQLEATGSGTRVGALLSAAREAIGALDAAGIGNDPARYRHIAEGLQGLPTKVDPSRLFQVDLYKPATITVGTKVANEVARAVVALAAIGPPSDDAALDEWKLAFDDRWEGREVPLTLALDEESGLGFDPASGAGAEGAPLLAGIAFPPAPRRPVLNKSEQHLVRRLTQALEAGHREIELDDTDLAAMREEREPVLPDAFAAMVRLGSCEDGHPGILLESAGGPSGARLLGRFCHLSREVRDIVDAHHEIEESLRPEAVFAEIVHLNEGRIGNILCRPVLRGHEIVFLGMSGAERSRQIPIDDILVSVVAGRIVLRSRSLDRELVPRLSTAHNYRLRSLGVYRFLCALAAQGSDLASFDWGILSSASFLPRVRLGQVVLSRAIWNLGERDLEPIAGAVRAGMSDVFPAVTALRRARNLPRFVALADGDNELPIDLDNPLLVAAFADEIAARRHAQLTEMFPAPDHLLVTAEDGRYTNQVILTFTRTRPAVRVAAAPAPAPRIRRAFAPGSEWLYAKIYCGVATADRVLREAVGPVVRESLAAGGATHWFFVRYSDPGHHLRVRLSGDPEALVGTVFPALERALAPLLASAAVHRWQLDTYERETERYGGDANIELVERLFSIDSSAVLDIIDQLDGDAGSDARWRLALRGIDGLLGALGLDPEARAHLYVRARDLLGAEHRATPRLWRALGARFARERDELEKLLARNAPVPAAADAHPLADGLAILAGRDTRIAEITAHLSERGRAGALSPRLADMAWSLAHMHANRLLHASQRAQEMVLYDFLRRLHATRRALGVSAREAPVRAVRGGAA